MREYIKNLLTQSLGKLVAQNILEHSLEGVKLNYSKDKKHGDFFSNIALILAKQAKLSPQQLAIKIVANFPSTKKIRKIEIVFPGFINFFVNFNASDIINLIIEKGSSYGKSNLGKKQKVLIEFVSANPTGPLHVGHGRGAAYGATIANLLEEVGFKVDQEYYVNDAGRQMDILTISIYLRYLLACGQQLRFADSAYQGNYIHDIAIKVMQKYGAKYVHPLKQIFKDVCADGEQGGDKEKHIDQLIANSKKLLKKDYKKILTIGLNSVLVGIKKDLADFGVNYQKWFFEQSLIDTNAVENTIKKLSANNYVYKKSGVLWFKNSDFNNEEDKVVVKANGSYTYFASDISYHATKFARGYDKIINIWGADHHGYIARIKASMKALGYDDSKLKVLLVQFVNLYKHGKKIAMSTRSGKFISLSELCRETGNDAARFFYVLRRLEQQLDFNIDLAKSNVNDNPVFYVQYAHARICSVFAKQTALTIDTSSEPADLLLLNDEKEFNLIKDLVKYEELVKTAAINYEPHILAYYMCQLAKNFHTYYNSCELLTIDLKLRKSRLLLVQAVKQVLKNGLNLLGISAPRRM